MNDQELNTVNDSSASDVETKSFLGESKIVSKLILDSSLYKEAVQILSADKKYGASYLAMLKMIPYSQAVRNFNFWDGVATVVGATSGYEKAVKDAFNNAMDEIRSLMQDYYSFLSKLPAEQVDQLRDAGINAAITGEGVTPSGMTSPDPSSLISANTPQSEFTNESLSKGITSFVEFIGSMANLASVGINSKNILGLLDLAEREGYNKQEVHDLFLANLGVTTDSPYRVLNSGNTPSIQSLSSTAQSDQRVKSAEAGAVAKALDSDIAVSIGDNPDEASPFEIRSGEDWLAEISRFQIANRFGNLMIQNLQTQVQQSYASTLSYLEGEYNIANYESMAARANYESDFFSSRDGSVEGANQTDLSTSLADLRSFEAHIKEVESWLADYRSNIIEHWGEQLNKRPHLAPYFYKAMFDFGMEDTFYHQSGSAQALKYGMQTLNSIGSFIGDLTSFKKPLKSPRRTGTTTRTSGPKGTTTTETTYHYDE